MTAGLFLIGILCCASYYKIKVPIQFFVGLHWLMFIWFFTIADHLLAGFEAKDEVYFASGESLEVFSNRFLWLLINQISSIFNDSVIVTMRVFNLGFVILLYYFAQRALTTFSPFVLAVALSYISCIAALNVRDPAILLGVLLFITTYGHSEGGLKGQLEMVYRSKWLLLFVALLRPFQAAMLVASCLRWYWLVVALFGSILFLQSSAGSRYFYNYAYFTQNITGGSVSKGR